MRVISGSAKGKKLATVKGTGIRPTADKVKMALFNILQHGVINFNFGFSDLSEHILMDIRRKKPFFIEKKFDLILADPPYGKEYLVNILEFVTRNDLLKSDGILVIEDDVRSELELKNNFKLIEKKNYGKTQLIFLIPN